MSVPKGVNWEITGKKDQVVYLQVMFKRVLEEQRRSQGLLALMVHCCDYLCAQGKPERTLLAHDSPNLLLLLSASGAHLRRCQLDWKDGSVVKWLNCSLREL